MPSSYTLHLCRTAQETYHSGLSSYPLCIITKPTVKITNLKCKALKIQRLLHRVYAQYLFPAILTIFWFALIWKTSAGGIFSFFKTVSRYPVKLQSISMLLDGDRKDPNFFFSRNHLNDSSVILICTLRCGILDIITLVISMHLIKNLGCFK